MATTHENEKSGSSGDPNNQSETPVENGEMENGSTSGVVNTADGTEGADSSETVTSSEMADKPLTTEGTAGEEVNNGMVTTHDGDNTNQNTPDKETVVEQQQEDEERDVEGLCTSLDVLCEGVKERTKLVQDTEMKDLDGKDLLGPTMMKDIEKTCGDVVKVITKLQNKMHSLHESLDTMRKVINKKIHDEDLSSYSKSSMGDLKRDEETEILATAARCRASLARINSTVTEASSQAASLEADAADASALAVQTRIDAEVTAKAERDAQIAAEAKECAEREAIEKEEERVKKKKVPTATLR